MKKSGGFRSSLLTAAGLLAGISAAHGQVLYSEDFNSENGSNWKVNALTGFDRAQFLFDYSTVGIPAAPNSSGTTLGVRLQANRIGGSTLSGVSISPIGQSFTGDYKLEYDLWQNTIGPFPGGGSGSTQMTGGGIMTSGNVAHYAGSGDGIWFVTSGDGNTTSDYRVILKGLNQAPGATGVTYDANSQANTAAYYSNFGSATPPAAQATLFSEQTGTTVAGAQAFAWHDVTVTKVGNTVTWTVDGKELGVVDIAATAQTYGGNNILFSQFDINTGSSTSTDSDALLFGLVDNVRVTAVPEPSTYALMGSGVLFLLARARRRN